MSDLFRGVLEITVAFPEGTTLGSKATRGLGLLLLGQGLAFPPCIPFAPLAARSSLGLDSRPASVGLATRIVHASVVISDGLAVMLLAVVAMAAQGAHATGALMICQTLRTLVAAVCRCLRAVLSEVVVTLTVATSDTRRPRRRAEGMNVVRRSPGIRPRLELQLDTLCNCFPGLGFTGRPFLSI